MKRAANSTVRWTTIVTLLVANAGPAAAQVNIESLRPDENALGVSGTAGLDLSVRTGNVDIVQFTLRGRLDHNSERSSTLLIVNGDLGFQGGDRFSNAALVHLRQGYRVRPRFGPEAFAQVNYNKPQRLDLRWLVGGGVRIGLLAAETAQIRVGSAYMFEHERLDLPLGAQHPRTTNVSRWSNYVSVRVEFGRDIVLTAINYLQPRIDRFGDLRNLSEVDLTVPVSQRISLLVSFDLRYDSRPPDDVRSLDTALKTGITAGF